MNAILLAWKSRRQWPKKFKLNQWYFKQLILKWKSLFSKSSTCFWSFSNINSRQACWYYSWKLLARKRKPEDNKGIKELNNWWNWWKNFCKHSWEDHTRTINELYKEFIDYIISFTTIGLLLKRKYVINVEQLASTASHGAVTWDNWKFTYQESWQVSVMVWV